VKQSIAAKFSVLNSIAPEYLQLDATFFATDGAVVIHPAPARYFEFPIPYPLPEGLNFIR
jgi:hypothetical protein